MKSRERRSAELQLCAKVKNLGHAELELCAPPPSLAHYEVSHVPGLPDRTPGLYSLRMTRQQVLDLYFMDARSKLIDLAAFIDRVERSQGKEDFRMAAFRAALAPLNHDAPEKARQVLLAFSDPTPEPIAAATTKAACGAWPGST